MTGVQTCALPIFLLSVPAEMAATGQAHTILVNGQVQPDIAVEPGERLRLRVINATGARGFALKLEGHAAWGIAIDGQPCEPFLARESRFGLGPGSRIDVCVDATLKGGATAPLLEGVREQRQVARLVYGTGGRPARRSEPAPLARNPLPARIDLKAALRVELTLSRADAIAQVPIFTAARGRPVSLARCATRAGCPTWCTCMGIISVCSIASTTAGNRIGSTALSSAMISNELRLSPTIPENG